MKISYLGKQNRKLPTKLGFVANELIVRKTLQNKGSKMKQRTKTRKLLFMLKLSKHCQEYSLRFCLGVRMEGRRIHHLVWMCIFGGKESKRLKTNSLLVLY
jgi:hypothetical protein